MKSKTPKMRKIILLFIKLFSLLAVTLTAVDIKSSMYFYVFTMQTYGKSMEYPPKFGRNANLKLGIKQLGENRGSWAEG